MARSYLESALAGMLPSFATEWDALRRAFAPGTAPTDADLLAALRRHVLSLLHDERIAEATRFFYALERLLGEADPILHDLLSSDLVVPLAAEIRLSGIDARRVDPYLGPRTRSAWR